MSAEPYTATHAPAYAYLDTDIDPVWSVVWVWPEKATASGPLTRYCPHRHRSFEAATRYARTRCDEVR